MPRPASLPSPHLAVPGDNGAPASEPPLMRKARALVHGETGLLFEPLVLFAEPLFDLYGLDPDAALALRHHPERADEGVLAALEAARVLWAYFALPEPARAERYPRLAAFLLGAHYSPADEADFEEVLDRMQRQWDDLAPEDRALAESGPTPPLDFDALLEHPALVGPPPETTAGSTYGPEALSELEAQALFAQPLLDAADGPEAMEAALERASAYWDLAHLRGDDRADLRERILRAYAPSPAERPALEAELEAMLARFAALFPEHAA